jgi:hypothetical protein
MFDDWKWKWGQPNPEPQMSDFQGATWQNPNARSVNPHIPGPQSAPTYGGTRTPTYDSAGYNTAHDRWQLLEDEKAKQQALFQEMALGTPSQTSAAQGGSVGKPTDLKTSIFDVSSGPKNTMATLEDFNVPDYPFLKRWRY